MLTIRFARIGKKKKAFYRIIISEKRRDTQGRYLELLGHYDPHTKAAALKKDRIKYWMDLGATLSDSVFNLLVKHEVIQSDRKRKVVRLSRKRKAALAERAKQESEAKAKPAEASVETGQTADSPAA